jgi:hypothetical protein
VGGTESVIKFDFRKESTKETREEKEGPEFTGCFKEESEEVTEWWGEWEDRETFQLQIKKNLLLIIFNNL